MSGWWRGLARWEKALAAAGVAGVATLAVAAAVDPAPSSQSDYCPGWEVTIDIDRTEPLNCVLRAGAQLNVRLGSGDFTPEAIYACEDIGGTLEHRHGQVICKDIDP